MPDLDDTLGDTSLRDAFESFRAGSLETVIPEGPDAVRHTVRRRHRTRVAAVAVVAALVVLAGGAGALAALNPVSNNHQTATHGSGTPSPSTSTSPSAKPKPSGSESGGTAPDGQIGATELLNATIDVPAWGTPADAPCTGGRFTFHNGEVDLGRDSWRMYLPDTDQITLPPLYFEDVDGDGAKETIAVLWCGAQDGWYQAIALDRDASGNIVTLGQIASTAGSPRPYTQIDQVTTTANGDVQLHWTAPYRHGDPNPVKQWRTYRWTGSGFEQVDGPTTIPSAPSGNAQLSVSAPNVTMTATGNGTYSGTLKLTVTNTGTAAVPEFRADVLMPSGATYGTAGTGDSGIACTVVTTSEEDCEYTGSLPAGGTVSISVPIQTTAGTVPTDGGEVDIRIASQSNYPITGSGFKLVAG